MPLSAYQQALDVLESDAKRDVEFTFNVWSADAFLGRVSKNVADETALETARFASLFNGFAAQLARGQLPVDA